VVTCRPLLEITRELAGDSATVDAVLPDDAEASGGWMPDPAAIAVLQSADAVVLNGAGYEPWLPQITLPASGIVDCSSGFSDQLIRVADAVTHQHGPKGAASGHQVVSSVWLDPELLRVQVAQIQDCLVRECPEDSADISARATRLTDEVAAVEDQLKHVGEELHQAQAAVYVDHQRLLYLIRPLGLESAVVSLPAEQAELQEVLSRLQKSVPEGGIAVLLISGGNTAELRSQLQDHAVAASVRLVEIDDCLTPSAGDGSLLRRMAENLDRLEKSLLPD
jgi:zinc transport system substrate-binding protein